MRCGSCVDCSSVGCLCGLLSVVFVRSGCVCRPILRAGAGGNVRLCHWFEAIGPGTFMAGTGVLNSFALRRKHSPPLRVACWDGGLKECGSVVQTRGSTA